AVDTAEEPDVHSRWEGQASSRRGDAGLHPGPVDTGASVGLNHAALWPRVPDPENMTTAQNGHGRLAAIPCSVSDPKDPKMVTYPACLNGGCSRSHGHEAEAPEARLSPAKLFRLFSVSRKRTGAVPERPRSVVLVGQSSTWNALASFRKMGSFKKLKSSVLQGIQNREAADASKEDASEHDLGRAAPNGAAAGVPPSGPGQGPASDCSDPEDADDAFQRSTHRSRSIRRAYGLGRISLQDCARAQGPRGRGREPSPGRGILGTDSENSSSSPRKSKSTDSLHVARKSSFQRKSASGPSELQGARGRPAPRRTLSSSSADAERPERRPRRWRSPLRAKDLDRVLRLVSGATDAACGSERARGGAPEAGGRLQRHSRLHDDYSRRASSGAELERARSRGAGSPGLGAALLPGPPAAADTALLPPEGSSSGAAESPRPGAGSAASSPIAREGPSTARGAAQPGSQFPFDLEQPSSPLRPTTPKPPGPQSPGTGSHLSAQSLSSVDSEERAEGPAQREQGPVSLQESEQATCGTGSEDSGASSPPQQSPCGAPGPEERRQEVVTEESWRRGPSPDEERTEAQRITCRRWGSGRRSRPRPLSDYGLLASRSLSIPEDSIAVDPQKKDIVDGDHQPIMASTDPSNQNPAVGCPKGGRRRRPISVIGGVSLYGNSQTEEIENLLTQPAARPPVPAHQVPPYKAVSARFRPFTFSQSTPIGLDRVGRRRQMRASNGEWTGPACWGSPLSETGMESAVRLCSYTEGRRPARLSACSRSRAGGQKACRRSCSCRRGVVSWAREAPALVLVPAPPLTGHGGLGGGGGCPLENIKSRGGGEEPRRAGAEGEPGRCALRPTDVIQRQAEEDDG
ncbi:hypothetical protein MC885_016564, partial [Smutsia gigantea]